MPRSPLPALPFLLVVLLVAAGCAAGGTASLQEGGGAAPVRIRLGDGVTMSTSGVSTETEISRSPVAAAPDEVWRRLPSVFRALGLEVNAADTRSRIVGVQDLRLRTLDGGRPSRYLECGQGIGGANADRYDIYLTLLAQVASAGTDASELQVQVAGFARDGAHGGAGVRCASNGKLETRVREVLAEVMAAGT